MDPFVELFDLPSHLADFEQTLGRGFQSLLVVLGSFAQLGRRRGRDRKGREEPLRLMLIETNHVCALDDFLSRGKDEIGDRLLP